jgi:hypothetical protein
MYISTSHQPTILCWHIRPTPHGRQAGRTVGGHWLRRPDDYPTRGYSRRGNLTGHVSKRLASSRGHRLEPPDPPATGSPDPTKTLAFQPLYLIRRELRPVKGPKE